jgi:hypothetical protein
MFLRKLNMTNYPLANVWFEEAVALLNSMGKKWNASIYFEDGLWYLGNKERGAYDVAYPSFSIAMREFLVVLERKMVAYVKPYEYKD